jgi:formylmethanofuran dehydrogenase subunit D
MANKDKNKISLEVEESPIKGEDGIARINNDIIKKLGVDEGKRVEVSFESESILLTIYTDKIIDKNKISIREGDREKLGVSKGNKVRLKPSIPI